MCATVRFNEKLLASPRQLREEIGRLVWHEDYTVCEAHDVWLDSCLCSVDIPASVEASGLSGDWIALNTATEFVVEAFEATHQPRAAELALT
jgi:hypothetical protein